MKPNEVIEKLRENYSVQVLKGEMSIDNIEEFEILWNSDGKNMDEEVAIFSFPEAAKELLERFPPHLQNILMRSIGPRNRKTSSENWPVRSVLKVKWVEGDPPSTGQIEEPTIEEPSTEEIIQSSVWDEHQDAAVNWFTDEELANGVGIFEMATGSGKTRTAMRCIRRLMRTDRIDRVVLVPNY